MKRSLWISIIVMALLLIPSMTAIAAGATTSVHVVKYADDGVVIDETDVTYQWLEENLPVQGDGVTHYYHQGPIFEGDVWDPAETENLKDKGAVMGTALKDLCELVGGMTPENEIMLRAVDGWHTEFAYENIYEPLDKQGVITLCWYNGDYAQSSENNGRGYPGASGYNAAMQIVFLAGTPNAEGKFVFGNSDMSVCLPDEKYQHFYEGLPSTNGLSGKWISEVVIFTGEPPETPSQEPAPALSSEESNGLPLFPLIVGVAGLVVVAGSMFILLRRKAEKQIGK